MQDRTHTRVLCFILVVEDLLVSIGASNVLSGTLNLTTAALYAAIIYDILTV